MGEEENMRWVEICVEVYVYFSRRRVSSLVEGKEWMLTMITQSISDAPRVQRSLLPSPAHHRLPDPAGQMHR